MSYIVKTIGEKVVLGVLLTKDSAPLSGLVPTVEIRRNSDGWYLDFSAVAPPFWKTVGGTREKVMPERSWCPGFYSYTFDQGYYDNIKDDYVVIYRNIAPYILYENEVISFNNEIAVDVSFIRKLLANHQTLEYLAPSHLVHTVFDDDKTTQVYKADITKNLAGTVETRDPV